MQLLFAFLHHLAVLTVFASALMCIPLLRKPFDLVTARRLSRIDMINGIAATLVLVVGLIRVAYFEKGTDYYFHNGPFIAKLALYGLASVLSLVPTLEIMRWRAFLKQGQLPVVLPQKLVRMRAVAYGQLACVIGMMAFAALAARGIDW
jgi:putative membrane protein